MVPWWEFKESEGEYCVMNVYSGTSVVVRFGQIGAARDIFLVPLLRLHQQFRGPD